jgi:hypothetical protein
MPTPDEQPRIADPIAQAEPAKPLRVKLYIDHCNFQTCLWEAIPNARIRWRELGAAAARIAAGFCPDWAGLECVGTEVFGSRPPEGVALEPRQANHVTFLERLQAPGVNVHIVNRKRRQARVHCKACGSTHEACPECGTPYTVEKEKGVDLALAMAMVADVMDGVCDGVIIASQDGDFVPAAAFLAGRGIPVINLGFAQGGNTLAEACTAMVTLEEIYADVKAPCKRDGHAA